MTNLTKKQLRDIAKLGYPNVMSCICSDGEAAEEGCGVGSHADVWKVASSRGDIAVAKFWTNALPEEKSSQERALRRAEKQLVSCMPKYLGSTKQTTIMSLCPGVTVDCFAQRVAADPTNFSVDAIERILVGFVHATSEIMLAGIYNDDIHDHNVLIDYPRRVVWIIDPYLSGKENTDSGSRIVKILSRCITIVAAHTIKSGEKFKGGLESAVSAPDDYVTWKSVNK